MEVDSILNEAWQQRGKGDYEKATELVEKATSMCREDDHEHFGRIFHIYAQLKADHNKPEEALKLYTQAQQHYIKSGNTNKIAHSTRHIADIQQELGLYEYSLSNYKQAIDIYRKSGDVNPGDLANALGGFANLLEILKENILAIEFWTKAGELYASIGLQEGVDIVNARIAKLRA